MALKAPGILIFLVSIVLALAVLFSKFAGATIPFFTGDTTYFFGLLAAYVVLVLGCIMRGTVERPLIIASAQPPKSCADLSRGFWCSGKRPRSGRYPAMARHRFLRERILLRRMRRWQREVALAIMLTVAAIAFIAAALLRGDGCFAGDAPYATARKPPQN